MRMKIVAAYKAYRGGEWFGASLESIAPFVEGIAVAISQRPWDASLTRPENCSGPLEDFRRRHPDIQVVAETVDFRRHEEHQVHCLEMVAKHFGADAVILTPDTDEVWGQEDLKRLVNCIGKNPGYVYTCAIWDYVKNPYWRIDNRGGGGFVVALSSPLPALPFRTTLRGTKRRENKAVVAGVRFHHFCFVREDETEITEKMHLCEMQDGVYRRGWLADVWSNLPNGKDLHPAVGCGRVWPKIEIVTRGDLPNILEQVSSSRLLLDKYMDQT